MEVTKLKIRKMTVKKNDIKEQRRKKFLEHFKNKQAFYKGVREGKDTKVLAKKYGIELIQPI